MKGSPLLEYTPSARQLPQYSVGYLSCVVPTPRPLPNQHIYTNSSQDEKDFANGVETGHYKIVHPVLGGPQPNFDSLLPARVLACCLCGVLLVVLLLYLLFLYVRQQTTLQTAYIDFGNVELYNAIYTNRIADIIRTSSLEGQNTAPQSALLGVTGSLRLVDDRGTFSIIDRIHLLDTAASERLLLLGDHLTHIHKPTATNMCEDIPAGLLGNLSRDVNHEHDTLTLSQVIASHLDIQLGGEWRPLECIARYRVALVIPYRDRLAHLTVLLAHLLPILKRQQLHFRVFVVEQYGSNTFNKGRIMNAAFKEALKLFDFQCVVFHDVDLIPEDDRNMYSCPIMPRHLSVAIDEMNYRLAYSMLVGGVLNMRVEHFQQANGYSNMYWGWGAEDDDMAYRILHVGLKIFRPPSNIARYQMIRHKKREPASWGIRNKLLTTAVKRYQLDGLNSVKYTVQFIHADQLFTHIMVDIGKPDIKAQR